VPALSAQLADVSRGISSSIFLNIFKNFSHFLPQSKPRNANNPNPMMIKPEILLSHCILLKFSNPSKMPVKPLRTSHHIADPVKTPETNIPAKR
jgi:hypothetical protein